ncbi:MAG: sigma-70 family RNA polymerase sigma factor [Pseudomonadota bacterium]
MQRNSEQILTEWLVLNAQSGKAEAIEQLLRLWYPKFLRYSVQQLRDQEAAKDVVQETLLTIAKKIRRLKDPVAFPKWAYQILHRRGVDYLRKEIRRRTHETSTDQADAYSETEQLSATPLNTNQNIREAIAELDSLNQNLIQLFYLHGLTLKEIATICRIPVGTVKSRLHTARGKLKNLLGEIS